MRESGGMLKGKAAIVFPCSNDAAQIRGAALPVDGGWLAQ